MLVCLHGAIYTTLFLSGNSLSGLSCRIKDENGNGSARRGNIYIVYRCTKYSILGRKRWGCN